MQCERVFSRGGGRHGSLCRSRYYQKSDFQVASTDLADGLPCRDGCFQVLLPNALLGDDNDDKDCIQVAINYASIERVEVVEPVRLWTEEDGVSLSRDLSNRQFISSGAPASSSSSSVFPIVSTPLLHNPTPSNVAVNDDEDVESSRPALAVVANTATHQPRGRIVRGNKGAARPARAAGRRRPGCEEHDTGIDVPLSEPEHEVSLRKQYARRKRAVDSQRKLRRSSRLLMAKEGDGFGQDMDMADKATRVQAARVDVSFSGACVSPSPVTAALARTTSLVSDGLILLPLGPDDDVQALSDVATACGSSSSEAEAELAEFMGFVDRGSIS
jgi:hypothetical protein